MNVRMLSLAATAIVVLATSKSVLANDSIVRDSDAVVRNGDIVVVNVSKILESVDEGHPQYSKLRKIRLDAGRELGAWPIVVMEDGTMSLPLIKSVSASGLAVKALEEKIRRSYHDIKLVRSNEIVVTAAKIDCKK